MFKTFELELDLLKRSLNDVFFVNSNDLNTVKLDLVIKEGELRFDLTGKIVRLAVKKPDGLIVFQDGIVTDEEEGNCEFVLNSQAILVAGKHEAELMIYEGINKVAVTTKFHYQVERAILNNSAVESTNEFQAINGVFAEVETILEDLRENGTGIDTQARQQIEALNTTKIKDVAGKTVEEKFTAVTSQLADTGEKVDYSILDKANATTPLLIRTYDGFHQTTHPKVLYFENKWNGWKYWMAHTPYPRTNDDFENPCISVSNNGTEWFTPVGLTNPLAQPTAAQHTAGAHYSDTHLVMNGNTMEIWYRFNQNGAFEHILRRTSTNGVTWTSEEIMVNVAVPKMYLSPVIIYENSKYRFWYVSENGEIMYMESVNALSWSTPVQITYTMPSGYIPWHLDIVKTDLGYEMLLNAGIGSISGNNKSLLCSLSADGLTWGSFKLSLQASANKKAWDGQMIYRSTFVKVDGLYHVFYSAMNMDTDWHVGLSIGKSLDKLVGAYNSNEDSYNLDFTIAGDAIFDVNKQIKIGTSYYSRDKIKLVNPGVASVLFKVSAPDEMAIRDGNDSYAANLLVNQLRSTSATFTGSNHNIKLLNTGVAGANLKVTDMANTLDIKTDDLTNYGFLRVSGIQYVAGANAPANLITGMTKWFDTDKKLKLYNKEEGTWYTLQPIRVVTTRPTTNLEVGQMMFDSTLNKPIWRNATNDGWVDNLSKFVSAPTSANSVGNVGEWSADSGFLYVCYAPNSWRRVATSTW